MNHPYLIVQTYLSQIVLLNDNLIQKSFRGLAEKWMKQDKVTEEIDEQLFRIDVLTNFGILINDNDIKGNLNEIVSLINNYE